MIKSRAYGIALSIALMISAVGCATNGAQPSDFAMATYTAFADTAADYIETNDTTPGQRQQIWAVSEVLYTAVQSVEAGEMTYQQFIEQFKYAQEQFDALRGL